MIRIALRRRLESLERHSTPARRLVVIRQQPDESEADMRGRLQSWQQGEADTGIGGSYAGEDLQVLFVCFE